MRLKLLQNIYRTFRNPRNPMAIFTQVVNPLTGQNEWAVQSDDYDYQMELTCTGFGDMLHDRERNQKYFSALRKAIARMHADGREVHVLDIGTGTGILSMMASSAGADSVTACEAFTPMANCAERILAANGFGDKVRLVKKRSTEMRIGEDMPQRANLLVAELLDTELIGEGAISIYNHAHDELLTDDVVCIPARATCYAQVVQSPLAAQWNTMKILADLDGNILLKPPEEVLQCKGEAAVHDVQLSQLGLEHFRLLTKPKEIFVFDFSQKLKRPTERQQLLEMDALQAGSTDLVFYWWDIQMYADDMMTLSCAPYWAHFDWKKPKDVLPWRDHWMQAIYYIPKPLHISTAGGKFMLNCNHDEYSLWFDMQSTPSEVLKAVPRHACTCGLHFSYPRSRIGQLNQSIRNKKYLNYLEQNLSKDSHVLCLGDGCILGLAIAKMGVSSVILCEKQTFSKRFMDSVQKSNKIENVEFVDNIEKLDQSKLSNLTHIFAEPYFLNAILPWDNFRFSELLQSLLDKLPPTVKIAPHSAKIFAVPVEFTDLHKIRTPVKQCEGFDLGIFDQMVKQARSVLPDKGVEAQPLWEYPCKALATPQEILHVTFSDFNAECSTSGTMKIESDGSLNGIAFWVEWNIDGGTSPKSVVSTGPVESIVPGKFIKWDMFVRQGVQLFEESHTVLNAKNSVQWILQYKPKPTKIEIDVHVKFP
ncbi:protein arginine N-methyltransferase 7 isoform X2 [Rhagoletis pomonella]|uniref:protein arginine N-methyltransferase 7 isoform X2 n=1 Tax=Rhagoletis pomonella TaxID=28610 RepID=UPI0017832F3E|nr:protein arginine N-methyltransferase 7 isoform X2 [Rhagoletis pomonella]